MLASKAGYGSAWLFVEAYASSVTRTVRSAQVASALVPLVAAAWPLPLGAAAVLPAAAAPPRARPPLPLFEVLPLAPLVLLLLLLA